MIGPQKGAVALDAVTIRGDVFGRDARSAFSKMAAEHPSGCGENSLRPAIDTIEQNAELRVDV